MRVELKFRDSDARTVQCFLADRYGKKRNTKLETLFMIAIRREVAAQAQSELDIFNSFEAVVNDNRQKP